MTDLFQAIRENNTDQIKNVVACDVGMLKKVNEIGQCDCVETIINDNPSSLFEKDSTENNAIHFAAQGGHIKVAEFLVSKGLNPSSRNLDGLTPLHIAAKNDKPIFVKFLLDNCKVNIDDKANNKYRAIHFAAEAGSTEAIKALIEHNPYFETEGFDTPENLAQNAGKPAAAREIKRYMRSGKMPKTEVASNVRLSNTGVQIEVRHVAVQVPELDSANTTTTGTDDKPKIIRRRIRKQLDVSKKVKKPKRAKKRSISKSKSRTKTTTGTNETYETGSEEEDDEEEITKTHTYEYETIEIPAKKKIRHKRIKSKSKSKTKTQTKTTEETEYYYSYSYAEEEEDDKEKSTSGSYLTKTDENVKKQEEESEEEQHKEEEDTSSLVRPNKALKLRYDPNDYIDENQRFEVKKEKSLETQIDLEKNQKMMENDYKDEIMPIHVVSRSINNPLFDLIQRDDNQQILEAVRNDESLVLQPNEDGITPLYFATMKGKFSVVEFLGRHGADINSTDSDGRTALHIAAIYGQKSLYHKLLSLGGRLDIKDKNGQTPNEIFMKRREIFEEFIGSCYHGMTSKAEECLNIYPSFVNEKDRAGLTGLIRSLENNHFDTFQMLLDHGADVNTKMSDGRTVLFYVVENNMLEWVELLLSKGADATVVKKGGGTLLGAAIKTKNTKIIELLMKSATQKSGQDPDGNTILQAAAKVGNYDLLSLLIDSGADIHEKGRDGDTVLLTVARKTFPNARLAFRKIMIAGADINARGNDGKTALHLAAASRNKDFVQALVAADAQINIRDKSKQTPLGVTTDTVIAEYLKSKGGIK